MARTALVKERTRLRNRSHVQVNPFLELQIKARLALVERQIAELDAEIARLIASDEVLQRKREILCSIPGLGPIAAALTLTFLPEIGTLDRKQAGSLAGLAPHSREPGQWKGKSFISGGRKPLRDALYMPSLVAMRFNPDQKAKYAALRGAGKPAKVAIVALMRKLLETANALVKANRIWTPKLARSRRILMVHDRSPRLSCRRVLQSGRPSTVSAFASCRREDFAKAVSVPRVRTGCPGTTRVVSSLFARHGPTSESRVQSPMLRYRVMGSRVY
mgnify:CR=1 FL=1